MKKQKTIGIFAPKHPLVAHWDSDSITKGITGSEEAIIYISNELAELGYKVSIFSDPPEGSRHALSNSNPRFLSINKSFDLLEKLDVAIVWRVPHAVQNLKRISKRIYFWPHDTATSSIIPGIGEFDDILWLSEWQRANWIQAAPICRQFENIYGNGLKTEGFLPKNFSFNPHSCIYGSNYGRGLKYLLDIWPVVKKEFPKATLDIYYGWQSWGVLSDNEETTMRKQIDELSDVFEHGLVGHKELNEAYSRASLWTYPCTAPETFCITALRAQFGGAIPVILKGSALAETVPHGYHCDRIENYLPTLLKALGDAEQISLADRDRMKDFILEKFTWSAVAKRWHERFESLATASCTY